MRIDYPVAIDNDYAVWSAFDNHYWPALYFADAQGRIRHHHFGEGEYQQSEMVIQQLLAEAGTTDHDHELVSVDARGAGSPGRLGQLRSPENYTGYERTENFASPGGVLPGKPHVYTAPAQLRLNHWALSGDWTIQEEAATLERPAGRSPAGSTPATSTWSWDRPRRERRAVPGAPRRAAARPGSRDRRGRRRATAPSPNSGCTSSSGSPARHRAHLRDHVPRPRRRKPTPSPSARSGTPGHGVLAHAGPQHNAPSIPGHEIV